jgi:hypothetical protein
MHGNKHLYAWGEYCQESLLSNHLSEGGVDEYIAPLRCNSFEVEVFSILLSS